MDSNGKGVAHVETKTVQTELPTRLLVEMESLVNQGWFRDTDVLIAGALRRFLESHRPELMEHHIWKDVDWGLPRLLLCGACMARTGSVPEVVCDVGPVAVIVRMWYAKGGG